MFKSCSSTSICIFISCDNYFYRKIFLRVLFFAAMYLVTGKIRLFEILSKFNRSVLKSKFSSIYVFTFAENFVYILRVGISVSLYLNLSLFYDLFLFLFYSFSCKYSCSFFKCTNILYNWPVYLRMFDSYFFRIHEYKSQLCFCLY